MKHTWRHRMITRRTFGGVDRDSSVECQWCREDQTDDNQDDECQVRNEIKKNGGWVGRE